MKRPLSASVSEDKHIPYETLARYVSNQIDRDERESVERHFEDCAYCRQDLADAQSWQTQNPAPKKKIWWPWS